MNSYRQIVNFHTRQNNIATQEEDNDEKDKYEAVLERQYIERKLETGKTRIWQDVQTKTKVFVLANDLSGLSIDAFLEFMDVIHRWGS